jgi:hypothetical protein
MEYSTLRDVFVTMGRLPAWKLFLLLCSVSVVFSLLSGFSQGFLRGLGLP